VLEKLKQQLLSEMPPPKRVSVHKPYKTKWKPHEVYVLQIKNPPKGKEEYLGWYVSIYVHGIRGHDFVVRGIEDMTPDVYLKISKEKPQTVSDLTRFEFACLSRNQKTGIGKFRYTFCEVSDRKYPKDIEYLGICDDFVYPEIENFVEPFSALLAWHSIESDAVVSYENELQRQKEVEELKRKGEL
jgi:hypothetical protein